MTDFTSALYLGLTHASGSLASWDEFTTGRPAALEEPLGATHLKRKLAQLVGLERATLGTSSLHLFWDLFGFMPGYGGQICMDAQIYPVARWGIERAAGRGVLVRTFHHHSPEDLFYLLRQRRWREQLVVTDGYCPDCGKPAPLAEYLAVARRYGARLVIDDTQALGVLGRAPNATLPYGHGGGGTLPYTKIGGSDVILIASLAKGLGAPIAQLAGGAAEVENFESKSETRIHCSPPSVAALNATQRALSINQTRGDQLRARLQALVDQFRRGMTDIGLDLEGTLFPLQTLRPVDGLKARELHQRLLRQGIRTLMLSSHGSTKTKLSFILTLRHTVQDIDHLIGALACASQVNLRKKEIKYASRF